MGFSVQGIAFAVTAPAPAALLGLWGFLIAASLTAPIQPYTTGAWSTGSLFVLALLGGLIGAATHRPAAATAVGIVLGAAAAVAIHLYVLAGRADYQPSVVASLGEPTWTFAVAGALLVAVAAIWAGYVGTRGIVTVSRIRRGGRSMSFNWSRIGQNIRRDLGATLIGLSVAIVLPVWLVGGSLLSTAKSAYLPPRDAAVIRVLIEADGTITSEPATVAAGRTFIVTQGRSAAETEVLLVGPLTTSDRIAVDQRLMLIDHVWALQSVSCCYWAPSVSRTEIGPPGMYAFVTSVRTQPPADPALVEAWRAQRISSGHTFAVTAEPLRDKPSTDAGGDGGTYLTTPVLAALGINAWAAGAAALRLRRDRPTRKRAIVGE